MKTFRSRPALHFVILGSLLFCADQYREWRASYRIQAPGEETLTSLYRDWQSRSGQPPSEEQRRRIREMEINNSVLFAEALRRGLYLNDPVVNQRLLRDAGFLDIAGDQAQQIDTALALGLHKGDEVIRRRLIQRMEAIGRASPIKTSPHPEPELRQQYQNNVEQWRQPAKIQLAQVFFSADKPRANERAQAARIALESNPLPISQAIALGDHFLLGHQLPLQSVTKLELTLGNTFIQQLLNQLERNGSAATPHWLGPVASAYGYHLVQVLRYDAPYLLSFEQVENQLRETQQRQEENLALASFTATLRQKYEITTP